MRLKVCHIIPTLDQGGAEKQMVLLASHLDRQRFDVHVMLLTRSGPRERELEQAGIPIHFIGKRGKFDPTAYWRVCRQLRQLSPHIVHTWLFAANSYGRLAARRAKVPVIVGGERCVDSWKRWWQFAIDRRLAKISQTIVTNTPAVPDFYNRHGIPASSFTVIPNAVLPSTTPALTREELCQRLGIKPRGKIVGAVGRLWKQKGYRDLIWAAELLHVAYGDVLLVIIGDGPDREQLQHYRDLAGARDSVRFVGHRRDAAELMSGFDVLWNGSLYEGQSNTILEAMSRGVPVVATDIPGNRDLIEHDLSGLLYPVGDVGSLTRHTNRLLLDDDYHRSLSAGALARVAQQFTLAKMVSAHEQLYHRLWQELA